ncbi:Astacin (Peptidase M12A), partial [Parelaphostrongylus tenuis]
MIDTIEEINADTRVDGALFQGDMLLTREQAEDIVEDVMLNEVKRKKRQAYRDSRYPQTLWSNGVSFSFHSNATQGARRVFRKAVKIWEDNTCINFREDDHATDKIVVFNGPGCFSHVGRVGGPQGLSLGPKCDMVGIAVHEAGHALGFFHTQSRHDRDDFITLIPQNFRSGWLSQFVKQSVHTNHNYNLTYDYGSIMHYGPLSVSGNGQPVMVPRDMDYMQTLGSRTQLSFYEKLMMNLHYKCLDKCASGASAKCKNGGFPHPRDCSKCICPSGYGGNLCDERPRGCGKILTATTSYQTLEDRVGEEGARYPSDELMMCNYWIQGPPGSKIEVILDRYQTGVSSEGCNFAGVEIKTGSDKRRTGY